MRISKRSLVSPSYAPCGNALPWPLLVAIASVFVTGCSDSFHFPGKPDPDNRFVRPDKVTDFETLFNRNCRGCHGKNGRLGPAPPLNDALFLAIVPDAELNMVISHGRDGTLMPAFAEPEGGSLTDEQIAILVKGLRQHWGKPVKRLKDKLPDYDVRDAIKKGTPPGNKDDGLKVFKTACAPCHGNDGKGGSTGGAVNNSSFLALISDQALRRLVITGRPDLGMPDYAGERGADFKPMTAKDINDVVALLAYWREQGK